MSKLIYIVFILLFTNSCNFFQDDYDNFAKAYKKILIAREIYQNDSLKSNQETGKILGEFGYTKESFEKEYYNLTHKNPQKFQEILDTLRETTQRELLEYNEKFRKKTKERYEE